MGWYSEAYASPAGDVPGEKILAKVCGLAPSSDTGEGENTEIWVLWDALWPTTPKFPVSTTPG